MQMIKLKDMLTEEAASKSDVKKMEKMADKIVGDMTKLNFMFRKAHKVSTGNHVIYSTLKDWESLTRDAIMKYGGWFDFVKDNEDYVK